MAKRSRQKLTNARVEAFRCGTYESGKFAGQAKTQDTLWDGGDGAVKGLGMRLSAKTGTRTFIFVGRVRGARKELYVTIGRYEDGWRLGCENPAWDPRVKAGELRRQMAQGIDPVEQQARDLAQRAATATTLRDVVKLYVQRKSLRPATVRDMMGHHDRNFADWLDKPVAGITKAMCLERFLRITKKGNKGQPAPHTANAAFVYLRSWLNFAREHHANPDGTYPILPVNPVTQMWKTQDRNAEVPRERAVPLDRVGHVWNYLTERRGQNDADLVATLMLTGCRLTECSSLRRQDVDLEKRTITLRGDVVKNHKEMILPMSELLHGVLAARCGGLKPTAYVFASDLSSTGYLASPRAMMDRVSELAGCRLSPHDLRRGLDSIAQACRIDSDTRRLMLNHISGDVHFRSYASRQGLAAAFEVVGQYVEQAGQRARAVNVVQFPARATA